MSGHTPGPWEVTTKTGQFGTEYFVGTESPLRCIAKLAWFGVDPEANARLIAAAPELLAALKIARDVVRAADEEREHPITRGTLDKCDAAIAKAEGR